MRRIVRPLSCYGIVRLSAGPLRSVATSVRSLLPLAARRLASELNNPPLSPRDGRVNKRKSGLRRVEWMYRVQSVRFADARHGAESQASRETREDAQGTAGERATCSVDEANATCPHNVWAAAG
ncbi:hypothetical protein PHYPSEUDO_013173 [Phytophthora pseudosyringae]|uniref:Uncharacterized protein n=1 Tax=Phytophthora pseudosyringae TaxID=221518 RepID=A0A8T1W768_9STRA|nr:hypothetical protein PHYPSEUDO_013173 [Phytophthora pseudosyringae]